MIFAYCRENIVALLLQMMMEDTSDFQQLSRVIAKKSVAVLDTGSGDASLVCVLMKWTGLGYDHCSWEWVDDPQLLACQVRLHVYVSLYIHVSCDVECDMGHRIIPRE